MRLDASSIPLEDIYMAMGYRGAQPEVQIRKWISEVYSDIVPICAPRYMYQILEVDKLSGRCLQIGGIDFHAALTGGLDGSAGRGAGAAGALVFSEEVSEDLSGGHVGVAVGVLQTGGVQIPGELAGRGASERGVVVVGLESGVVALAPLGIVAAHIGLSQRHSLAVLALAHAGELDAAAGLAGLAVGGGGVEDDHAAILTDTQADPHVAVHAEDVAGLEVPGGGEFLGPGTEVVGLGKGLSHLGGTHDVAVVAALGVHDVVGDPGHVGGAVHAGKVILVPGVVGIVGMGSPLFL